ncbi:hypothetical protein MIR68_008575 [Amoeboaphelidium protococcarum]|nr:hypothetical protein MIR68_008575 [Amoeboaphelidium protococcarum]
MNIKSVITKLEQSAEGQCGAKQTSIQSLKAPSEVSLFSMMEPNSPSYDTASRQLRLLEPPSMPLSRALTPEPMYRVRVIENMWIPLSDGNWLAARVWMPETSGDNHDLQQSEEKFPAILEYLPYGKRHGTAHRDEETCHYVAKYGFIYLRVDIRGTGESTGLIHDEYLPQEQADALEIIEWISKQSWCSGNVGLTGLSWGGFNSLQIAGLRPPALKGVIALCCSDNRYETDVHYSGGCLLNDNVAWGAYMLTHICTPPDPALVGDSWREEWTRRIANARPWLKTWLEHQHYDEYWKQGSVCENYDSIDCPVLAASGWDDGYCSAIPNLVDRVNNHSKHLTVGFNGPWAHDFPHFANPAPAVDWLAECIKWWSYCLKGDKSMEVEWRKRPKYSVYMRAREEPEIIVKYRQGRWISMQNQESQMQSTSLYLSHDRKLVQTSDNLKKKTYKHLSTGLSVGMDCGRLGYGKDPDFPLDQRHEDASCLCFDSEILQQRTEIVGRVKVNLLLSSEQEHAQIAVRICDVDPKTGQSVLVTFGVLNLAHCKSSEYPQQLIKDKVYKVTVQCDDVAHAFPAGNKIRIGISTSLWPIVWPSVHPAKVNLFTKYRESESKPFQYSHVDLPVYVAGGDPEAQKKQQPKVAGLYREPRFSPPLPRTELRQSKLGTRSMTNDYVSGMKTLTMVKDYGNTRDDTNGIEHDEWTEEIYRIQDPKHKYSKKDPLSAEAQVKYCIEIGRSAEWIEKLKSQGQYEASVQVGKQWRTRVETLTKLRSDKDNFHLQSTLQVFEYNGDQKQLIHSQEWNDTIKRTLI